MSSFPKEPRLQSLLDEVATCASDLKPTFTADVVTSVHKVRGALSAPVTARGHLPLVLSAARKHIQELEKRVVGLIIGDEPVYQREMASLVRIRLICAQLLAIIASTLAELKVTPQPNKLRSSGYTR